MAAEWLVYVLAQGPLVSPAPAGRFWCIGTATLRLGAFGECEGRRVDGPGGIVGASVRIWRIGSRGTGKATTLGNEDER